MSKSLNNYIGIQEPPQEMFGKLMSISDTLMWRYLDLLSFQDNATLAAWRREVEGGANPRDVKVRLAREIVTRFHGPSAADAAEADFVARFQKGAMPEEMPDVELDAGPGGLTIARILKDAGLTPSTSEAQRLIRQGGVRIDGERVADGSHMLPAGASHVFQVGKRKFARVRLR
jgi:tyrosyl-tRNA synthetase